jgi:hypothetical protein
MDDILKSIESGKLKPIQGLDILRTQNSFLFHGTPRGDIVEIEPRQALNNDNQVLDGPPAIFASSLPSIAIFLAITSGRGRKTSYAGRRYTGDEDVTFYATEDVLATIADPNNHGYVYIFNNKEPFINLRGHEFTSIQPCKPLGKVKVTNSDMPMTILEIS